MPEGNGQDPGKQDPSKPSGAKGCSRVAAWVRALALALDLASMGIALEGETPTIAGIMRASSRLLYAAASLADERG